MFKHSRELSDKILLIGIALLVVAALAVAAVFVVKLNRPPASEVIVSDVRSEETPSPLIIDSGYQVTPAPSVTPAPTPLPAATPQTYEYLPTWNSASTTEHVIAITLDDLSDQAQFANAVNAANRYSAKLTLFPHGSALSDPNCASAVRYCVETLGYQVENRTMNNLLLYQLEGSLMAQEIWLCEEAVEDALGADYTVHLLRTRSNLGTMDPRTNDYLKKLGYDGFIGWSVNGNRTSLESLYAALKPGAIYYFTTQQADVQNMIQLMRYASSRGYRMVTVNELLGFPANQLAQSRSIQTMPVPDEYQLYDLTFQQGSRAWQVYLIQQRLIDLGYLGGNADGIFGETTTDALMLFQSDAGLMCTGIASLETQALLFGDDAPVSTHATAVPQETGDPDIPFLPVNTGPIENVTQPPRPTNAPLSTIDPSIAVTPKADAPVETPAPVAMPTDAGPATPDPLDVALGRATPLPGGQAQRTPSPAAMATGVPVPELTQAPPGAPQAPASTAASQATSAAEHADPGNDIPTLAPAH